MDLRAVSAAYDCQAAEGHYMIMVPGSAAVHYFIQREFSPIEVPDRLFYFIPQAGLGKIQALFCFRRFTSSAFHPRIDRKDGSIVIMKE